MTVNDHRYWRDIEAAFIRAEHPDWPNGKVRAEVDRRMWTCAGCGYTVSRHAGTRYGRRWSVAHDDVRGGWQHATHDSVVARRAP